MAERSVGWGTLSAIGILTIVPALALSTMVARADEALYNGIVLPSAWPPDIRYFSRDPKPVPYLDSPPAVIKIDTGRQLFVDRFLIESSTLAQKFHPATVHSKGVLTPDKPY